MTTSKPTHSTPEGNPNPVEHRKFALHPQTIYSIIVAQAGTLGKAVLECVMNSIDAQATQVDIQINAKSIRISDDGHGFRSRAEIEQWFEIFGFPHEEGDRTYGKFGVGRGQLWSFASTVWRTETFAMHVDIKRKGIDYELVEGLERQPGVLIEGSFYDKLFTADLIGFENELADLARYAQIPVILNGRRISKDPIREKWDYETDDAWIRLSETSPLTIYNLGVQVRDYPASTFGTGGAVVTKPGVRLNVNMARNDVLVAQCPVWKRIRTVLQKCSDERLHTKKTRVTNEELQNRARRFLAGELAYADVAQNKLITDIVGRGHTLESMHNAVRRERPLTVAPVGSAVGERAHQTKLAFVLSPITLTRFGAQSLEDLRRKLTDALLKVPGRGLLRAHIEQLHIVEDLSDAAQGLQDGREVLKEGELSKRELAALRALSTMARHVGYALMHAGALSTETGIRTVRVGVSDVSRAWTDGRTFIVVERKQLTLMNEGIGGFSGLASLLVHEYIHDRSDAGSHAHDYEFYLRYHEMTCGRPGILYQAVILGLCRWVQALQTAKVRVPKVVAEHLDAVERMMRQAEPSSDEGSEAGELT